ncbi:MAG TPA: ESPR domain-containing protein [Ramlibacter sp.]|nr:ESPR domain-containing protein [Ramlibacter sp.]
MNRSYRSIWNEALGAWVAASEITSANGKRSKAGVREKRSGGAACRALTLGASLLLAGVALPSQANTISTDGACGANGHDVGVNAGVGWKWK